MAEANVSDTGSSIDVPTPDEFSSLDQFHQREAYKRVSARMCQYYIIFYCICLGT